jgi:hypothetical protein
MGKVWIAAGHHVALTCFSRFTAQRQGEALLAANLPPHNLPRKQETACREQPCAAACEQPQSAAAATAAALLLLRQQLRTVLNVVK